MTTAKTLVRVEYTPMVPGLVFRGFEGDHDFENMAEIINQANRADKDEYLAVADEIRTNYKHMERSEIGKDMLFAEVNGEAVAYGRVMWDAETEGDYLYSFFVHMKPDWRGKGIGKAMIAHFIKRSYEMAAEHSEDAPKYLQSWSTMDKEWYNEVMAYFEMDVVRYGLEMKRPCSQPMAITPLPEGLIVRPPTKDELRKVWEAEMEAFRDHWGYVEPTEKDYAAYLDFPYLEPEIWKVAWDGDEVAGMVRNFISPKENEEYNRKRGYTEFISVRRPWRRKGVARALLTQSIKMFQEMGMEETVLGVDTDNPNGAKRLYESVGYLESKRVTTHRKRMNQA